MTVAGIVQLHNLLYQLLEDHIILEKDRNKINQVIRILRSISIPRIGSEEKKKVGGESCE